MKLTEEVIQAKMRFQMERAKRELIKAPPSSDPDITPIPHAAIAIWNNGMEKEFPGKWKGIQEKRMWGYAISKACELAHVSAVILRSIGTGVLANEVASAMGIDHQAITLDEWHDRLYEWVERTTGQRRLAGLPAKFRFDYIIIFAMGPRFKDRAINQPYEWKDGKYHFPPSDVPDDAEMRTTLIPKWWQ